MAEIPSLQSLRGRVQALAGVPVSVAAPPEHLLPLTQVLMRQGWWFIGLAPDQEEPGAPTRLRYLWQHDEAPWLCLDVTADGDVPSITGDVYAADWPEREAEDLFGVRFSGHPVLGNFVLHDEVWAENLEPMREPVRPLTPEPRMDVERPSIVTAPGRFAFPIGPVFSGVEESVELTIETVGEEVVYPHVRLFYKYRGIERMLTGRTGADAVLLAERCNGPSAFAHATALSQALESLCLREVPARAYALRLLFAELERVRSHIRSLSHTVESTGLSLPANWLIAAEESLLQLSGEVAGHRYLFGLNTVGGLTLDVPDEALASMVKRVGRVLDQVDALYERLTFDNSFLDRLEEVGSIAPGRARLVGMVGPVARASAVDRDVRRHQPYGAYRRTVPRPVTAEEGDGYARFRVFHEEARAAFSLMEEAVAHLPAGPVRVAMEPLGGTAVGAVEAPGGTLAYYVRTGGDGTIRRCHIMPPNFANWHAVTDALRGSAFQDVPIILATFGFAVADADR